MSELAQLTRELIALRDKASAAPWGPFTPMTKANCDFAIKAHEVSAHFLALLAENDRLKKWRDHALKYDTERMDQRNRAEAAELEAQQWKGEAASYQRQFVLYEAKLRELCEMEPLFWSYRINNTYDGFLETKPPEDAYDVESLIPLIPRPTMPESGK